MSDEAEANATEAINDDATEATDDNTTEATDNDTIDPTTDDTVEVTADEEDWLFEYEIASEEARYRDRLLFTSFYLSLVFLALTGKFARTVYQNGEFGVLAVVSAIASVAFFILLTWTSSVEASRNAAWMRRHQLENDQLADRPIEMNQKIVDNFHRDDGEYATRETKWYEKGRSTVVIRFTALILVLWSGSFVYATAKFFGVL